MESEPEQRDNASNGLLRTLCRLLVATSGVATLYFLPYESLTTTELLIWSCILAIPIAAYRLEYRLYARRAVIEKATNRNGFIRRRFWNGSLSKLLQFAVSVFLATIVLVLGSSLKPEEWLIVIGAILVLIISEITLYKLITSQTSPDFRDIALRGISKWPVIAFIVSASAFLFFDTAYPSYIGVDPLAVATAAFELRSENFTSPAMGWANGILGSADALTMYLGQNFIPRIDDTLAKWALWTYLAVKSSLTAGIITYLIFGLLTLTSIVERSGWKALGATVFDRWFSTTLALMILAYAYAVNIKLLPPPTAIMPPKVNCEAVIVEAKDILKNHARTLQEEEEQLISQTNQRIDSDIDQIFSQAEAGVEQYLNWHFSVLGEYQQLGAKLMPTLTEGSTQKLEEAVFGNINRGLDQLNSTIDDDIVAKIQESAGNKNLPLPQEDSYAHCLEALNLPSGSIDIGDVYVGHPQTIVAGGAVATLVMKKTAAKVTAKGIGKAATKYGATLATGLTAAGLCGPAAPICGFGAAVVTWFAVDAVIVTADEILNREELKAEIMQEIDSQKASVKEEMQSLYKLSIIASYDLLEKRFEIPEDGV